MSMYPNMTARSKEWRGEAHGDGLVEGAAPGGQGFTGARAGAALGLAETHG